MRKFQLTLAIIWLFTGMSLSRAEGYKYTVTIKNFQEDILYLGYPYEGKYYLQDTAKVVNGDTFIFEGDKELDGGLYFIYHPKYQTLFNFILAEPQFSMETDTSDFFGHLKFKGSKENKIFSEFGSFMKDMHEEKKPLVDKIKASAEGEDTQPLLDQLSVLDDKVTAYRDKLIADNKGTFAATFIKSTIEIEVPESPKDDNGEEIDKSFRYNYYISHYFDNIDFTDSRMLRTPTFHNKVIDFLDNIVLKHPDSVSKQAINIIEKTKPNNDMFWFWVVSLTSKYETSNIMGYDAIFVDLAKEYYLTGQAFWADSAVNAKIAKKVGDISPTLIGKQAPPLYGVDTSIRAVDLYRINSPYTIIYIYSPDCGHCRKKTPVLRDAYNNKLKAMGAEVLAVTVLTDIDNWKKYVKDYRMSWINMADPYLRCNFRVEYDTELTPKILIVDKKKKIIAKGIDVEQIEDFLKHHMQMKEKQDNL